jgi:hypothetical protein
VGPKPLYTFIGDLNEHMKKEHPKIKLGKNPYMLDYNYDFEVHHVNLIHNVSGNEYTFRSKKYTENAYSVVLITEDDCDSLFRYVDGEYMLKSQKDLKIGLSAYFI